MDASFSDLNFNSVVTDAVAMLPCIENLTGFEARAKSSCFPPASAAVSANAAFSASTT